MHWEEAPDVRSELQSLLRILDLPHINIDRIFIYRTRGSKARAYARTWGFPKIFQEALQVEPAYVIEVLAEFYDTLDDETKKKVLIHELLHIPKNFSGALLPHKTKDRHLDKVAKQLFKDYQTKAKLLSPSYSKSTES